MGPVSQGTMNDLMNLASVVEYLTQEGAAGVLRDIKAQMDELTLKGAQLAETESNLKALDSELVERQKEIDQLLAGAKGKHEEAAKKLSEAAGVLETANRNAARLQQDQDAFADAKVKTITELAKREKTVSEREVLAEGLIGEGRALKAEYEEKLEALKKLAG